MARARRALRSSCRGSAWRRGHCRDTDRERASAARVKVLERVSVAWARKFYQIRRSPPVWRLSPETRGRAAAAAAYREVGHEHGDLRRRPVDLRGIPRPASCFGLMVMLVGASLLADRVDWRGFHFHVPLWPWMLLAWVWRSWSAWPTAAVGAEPDGLVVHRHRRLGTRDRISPLRPRIPPGDGRSSC